MTPVKPINLITIIGARPQFVKAAMVSREIARVNAAAAAAAGGQRGEGNRQAPALDETIVHTGQHFDANMSDVFFAELDMPKPALNLGIGGGSHGSMTGAQLAAIETVLLQEKPDWVLVYGDTNSTLAGGLAAAKLNIPVAHVEAGLRSFNRRMPEEVNRVLVDHLSSALFAPTEMAMRNLAREGIAPDQCHLVGDVMFDAALAFGQRVRQRSKILGRLGLAAKEYVLATVHRAENTGDRQRLRAIIGGLNSIAGQTTVVWPVHPRIRNLLQQSKMQKLLHEGIRLIEPVGYLDMVMLEQNAALIATDSGGVQKEAFFHRVPCVTLRAETEWTELIDAGWNRLAPPTDEQRLGQVIVDAIGSRGRDVRPYGDGQAARLIVERLLKMQP